MSFEEFMSNRSNVWEFRKFLETDFDVRNFRFYEAEKMQDGKERDDGLLDGRGVSKHSDIISTARDGDADQVRLILEISPADVNKVDHEDGRQSTRLILAAKKGHVKVIA
eukprot:864278_1